MLRAAPVLRVGMFTILALQCQLDADHVHPARSQSTGRHVQPAQAIHTLWPASALCVLETPPPTTSSATRAVQTKSQIHRRTGVGARTGSTTQSRGTWCASAASKHCWCPTPSMRRRGMTITVSGAPKSALIVYTMGTPAGRVSGVGMEHTRLGLTGSASGGSYSNARAQTSLRAKQKQWTSSCLVHREQTSRQTTLTQHAKKVTCRHCVRSVRLAFE